MTKFILRNPGKAFWMLLCIIGIVCLEGRPDFQVILFGWAVCPTFVLYQCEARNVPHKWLWAAANFLLPWITIWIFIILKGGKETHQP